MWTPDFAQWGHESSCVAAHRILFLNEEVRTTLTVMHATITGYEVLPIPYVIESLAPSQGKRRSQSCADSYLIMIVIGVRDRFFWFQSHGLSNILLNKLPNKYK